MLLTSWSVCRRPGSQLNLGATMPLAIELILTACSLAALAERVLTALLIALIAPIACPGFALILKLTPIGAVMTHHPLL